jgi:hypothetical protein
VPNLLKSASLNLLEPSGPVQACNGIDFFILSEQLVIIQICYYVKNMKRSGIQTLQQVKGDSNK